MQSGKIVIYSRQSHLASLVAAMLHGVGARITCCTSVEQVVSACQREQTEIVIAVAVAPLINGEEFVARVRRKGESRPVIYVVAWQQSEQIVLSLLECGVDQYLTFPICIPRLRMKTQAQLNKFAER